MRFIGRRGRGTMLLRFDEENYNHAHDEESEKKEDLAFRGAALVIGSLGYGQHGLIAGIG